MYTSVCSYVPYSGWHTEEGIHSASHCKASSTCSNIPGTVLTSCTSCHIYYKLQTAKWLAELHPSFTSFFFLHPIFILPTFRLYFTHSIFLFFLYFTKSLYFSGSTWPVQAERNKPDLWPAKGGTWQWEIYNYSKLGWNCWVSMVFICILGYFSQISFINISSGYRNKDYWKWKCIKSNTINNQKPLWMDLMFYLKLFKLYSAINIWKLHW